MSLIMTRTLQNNLEKNLLAKIRSDEKTTNYSRRNTVLYNEQKKIDLLALVFNGVYSYCIRKKNVRTAFQGSNGNYSCPCIYYIAAALAVTQGGGGLLFLQ